MSNDGERSAGGSVDGDVVPKQGDCVVRSDRSRATGHWAFFETTLVDRILHNVP